MKELIKSINKNEINASYVEYIECVSDLLQMPEILKLDDYKQHISTSRFEHSIYVSYYSYKVCKKFGLDYKSAARGGLLHDLFFYDWKLEKQPEGNHAHAHPKVALRNAKTIVDLNEVEADSIVKHMWPLTIVPPKYKESMIVSLIDKYSATVEVSESLVSLFTSFQRNIEDQKKIKNPTVVIENKDN